ncbi:MAG: nitrilase-related carbon-nitrogen hydrolase, partial [Gammaproteobacteria bacterium]
MKEALRIALAQLNMRVGDISFNAEKIISNAEQARDELHADLIVFPELSLTGYPPEDLLMREGFIEHTRTALEKVTAHARGIDVIVGVPMRED